MADRHVVAADEAVQIRVEQRTFDVRAGDRVRTVQNIKRHLRFGRFLHPHRAWCTNKCRSAPPRPEYRRPGRRRRSAFPESCDSGRDRAGSRPAGRSRRLWHRRRLGRSSVSVEAVLRREQRRDLTPAAIIASMLRRPCRSQAGLIGDQPDAFALQAARNSPAPEHRAR